MTKVKQIDNVGSSPRGLCLLGKITASCRIPLLFTADPKRGAPFFFLGLGGASPFFFVGGKKNNGIRGKVMIVNPDFVVLDLRAVRQI